MEVLGGWSGGLEVPIRKLSGSRPVNEPNGPYAFWSKPVPDASGGCVPIPRHYLCEAAQ